MENHLQINRPFNNFVYLKLRDAHSIPDAGNNKKRSIII